MNEIYILEPEGFQTAIELMMVLGKFGSYNGRYLARCPNDIQTLLKKTMDSTGQVEAKRISSIFQSAEKTRVFQLLKGLPWNTKQSWGDNVSAILSHSKKLDGLIVFNINTDNSKNIYHVSEIVNWGTAEERIYGVADEYVRASKSLLNTNQEIYFIDPYLNPLKERTYKVLLAYLNEINKNKKCTDIFLIARYSTLVGNESPEDVFEKIRAKLILLKKQTKTVYQSITLRLSQDERESFKMHGRYLLTINGGIQFDQGFQELSKGVKVDVTPIGERKLDELWSCYITGQPFSNTVIKEISV